MRNTLKRIQDVCKNSTGNIVDVYFVLYKECLAKEQEAWNVLKDILVETQHYEFVDDGEPICVDKVDVEKTKDLYFKLLKEYVQTLLRENLEENEFYKRLYDIVFQSNIFGCEEQGKAILLYFLAEKLPGIPYFQATNLLEMDSENYKKNVQRLRPELERAIDVLNRRFKSRTEEASQIYEIMSTIGNREDKIVFLSAFINIVQKNTIRLIKDNDSED